MGFWDVLLGRTRLRKPEKEPLFSLTPACLTLETHLGWQPARRAGVCLKPVTSGDFRRVEADVLDLVKIAGAEFKSKIQVIGDKLGFVWVLLEDEDLEDLTTLVHLVGQTLDEEGYGGQLLAAVFRFQPLVGPGLEKKATLFLVYSYKRGLFYPYSPKKDGERDLAEEMRVAAVMGRELPIDKDQSRWFPINECPV